MVYHFMLSNIFYHSIIILPFTFIVMNIKIHKYAFLKWAQVSKREQEWAALPKIDKVVAKIYLHRCKGNFITMCSSPMFPRVSILFPCVSMCFHFMLLENMLSRLFECLFILHDYSYINYYFYFSNYGRISLYISM